MNLENVACISAYRRYDQKGILQPMQSATSLTNRPARQLRPFDREDLCTAQVGRGGPKPVIAVPSIQTAQSDSVLAQMLVHPPCGTWNARSVRE